MTCHCENLVPTAVAPRRMQAIDQDIASGVIAFELCWIHCLGADRQDGKTLHEGKRSKLSDTSDGRAFTSQQRRESIPESVFATAIGYAARLAHVICNRAPSPEGADALMSLLREASGGTADGRWVVAEMLVTFLRGNLETQGIVTVDEVGAKVRAIYAPPDSAGPATRMTYLRDMDRVRDFVCATMRDDFDTAMALADAGGEQMGPMLCSLVAATCPIHPLLNITAVIVAPGRKRRG